MLDGHFRRIDNEGQMLEQQDSIDDSKEHLVQSQNKMLELLLCEVSSGVIPDDSFDIDLLKTYQLAADICAQKTTKENFVENKIFVEDICIICYDAPASYGFNCGHVSLCLETCAKELIRTGNKKCPICQAHVTLTPISLWKRAFRKL